MWHRTIIYTFLIFLLLHVIAQTSFAQTGAGNNDSTLHEYIENYKDLLTCKLSLGSKEDGFDLDNTSRYKIRSNNKTKLNAGINYRWLAFGVTFAPNLFNQNAANNIKGETRSFGFGFSSNFHHIIQKINYSRVKGYYLDNTNAFDPTWKAGDPYIHLPGLIFRSFSGQTAYKFNDNFSFNAINSQTERQVKSAGTFLPSVSYEHFVVKGYYLDNTNAFDPTWKAGDPYIHLPGLIFRSFSGQTAYKFNDNFSFNAINSQTERQLKSAGTFLPSISYRHFVVKDPTPLPSQTGSQKSKTLEVVFSPGYYYTLVTPSNLYASAGVSPGIGFSRTKLLTREPSGDAGTIYKRTVCQVESILTFGYDSRRFFTGIQIATGAYGYSHSDADYALLPRIGSGSLFIGYRFNAPKKLTAAMDKTEKLAADKLQQLKEKVQQ